MCQRDQGRKEYKETEYDQQCHMWLKNEKNDKWEELMSWYLSGHQW